MSRTIPRPDRRPGNAERSARMLPGRVPHVRGGGGVVRRPEGAAVRRTGVDMHRLGGRRARARTRGAPVGSHTRTPCMVSSWKNEEEEWLTRPTTAAGTRRLRRGASESIRFGRFGSNFVCSQPRVVPAPTDGRAARRRPARAARTRQRTCHYQAILEGARPSNLRAHSAPSRTRARTRHPETRATPISRPHPFSSPAQPAPPREKQSPPTDDDNKGLATTTLPVGPMSCDGATTQARPFFKRPKEIQQRLSERGRKIPRHRDR